MRNRSGSRRLVFRGVGFSAIFVLALIPNELVAQAQQFYSVTPCRAVDTRNGFGGIVPASTLRTFTVKGVCGVPGDAKSVALNATVITPSVSGFILLWPDPAAAPPPVSNMNFTAGTPALANGVVVGLRTALPDLAMAYGSATGSGTLHLVLDVTGYFK